MWIVVRECTNIKMLLFGNWMNTFRKHDAFTSFQTWKCLSLNDFHQAERIQSQWMPIQVAQVITTIYRVDRLIYLMGYWAKYDKLRVNYSRKKHNLPKWQMNLQ